VYYMPALIRLTVDTMDRPQERYLEQLLFHLIYDGKDNRQKQNFLRGTFPGALGKKPANLADLAKTGGNGPRGSLLRRQCSSL
jgi:hypothetical protein